jgi:hypothetical protein
MRTVLVSFTAILCLGLAYAAHAERRMFVIGNDPDGYGIDRCLASGAKCGVAAANAYCQTQQFQQAMSFSKVDRDDITGSIPAGDGCNGSTCNNLVAIVCTR